MNLSARPVFQLAEQQLDRKIDRTLNRAVRVVNRLVHSKHGWGLPTALTRLAMAIRILTLRFEMEGRLGDSERLRQLGLQMCKAAAAIANVVAHDVGRATAASAILLFSRAPDDESYRAALLIASEIKSADERDFVNRAIAQTHRLHRGERIEGRIKTTPRQALENIRQGIDAANRLHPKGDSGHD